MDFNGFWLPFGLHFRSFFIICASLFRVSILYRFFIDFGVVFPSNFHHFSMQNSFRYRTSRTLFLDNSMVFCADFHVFDLLVFHVFPVFFGTTCCIDFYLLFDLIFHHFRRPKRIKTSIFYICFLHVFWTSFFHGFRPKWS